MTYARSVSRHPARRPVPVGGEPSSPMASATAHVPVRRRRHPIPEPGTTRTGDHGRARRRRTPRCSSPSPRLVAPVPRRRHRPRRLRLGAAVPSPPARHFPPTCSADSATLGHPVLDGGTGRPRRSTSSCPTPPPTCARGRRAHPCPARREAARRHRRRGHHARHVRVPPCARPVRRHGYWSRTAATQSAFRGDWLAPATSIVFRRRPLVSSAATPRT